METLYNVINSNGVGAQWTLNRKANIQHPMGKQQNGYLIHGDAFTR